ncbi:unnamed protein product [Durusdinium trenchii]|uniref:EamA domain-containing protein n=1 Tax=Durusdinium trenchii TaxID=1381693 RepID=A0ABP0Q7R5_9DINO
MAWEEDEEWRKVPPHSRGRHVQGIIMLAACLVLWVSSSAAVQLLATNSVQQFQQPLFVTLFNSTMGILLLAPYLLPKTDLRSGLVATGWMSATVGILWLCSQCLYNVSLLHTSVATNTVLSSTSSIFTFVLSLLTGNHFRPRSCVGVLLCFLGSCLVAFQTPTDASTWAVHSTYTGEALALLAAALFSLCSVLLEHQSGRDFDPGLFLGLNRSRERIWEGLKGEDVQM